MFLRKLLLAMFVLVATGGCVSTWTSIRQKNDGSYILTRNQQGCARTYGEVYRCVPKGKTLECRSIDRL